MEKRSHRRIRDLNVLAAFQGLVANEIGCARISMMAREQTLPSMGRIQMRETNYLQIATSSLHRTAGPYKIYDPPPTSALASWRTFLRNHAEALAAIVAWFRACTSSACLPSSSSATDGVSFCGLR